MRPITLQPIYGDRDQWIEKSFRHIEDNSHLDTPGLFGLELIAVDTVEEALDILGHGTFDFGGYAAGRYITGPYYGPQSSTTFAVTANLLYWVPFGTARETTWTRIGIDVTAAAGTSARLGIYSMADGVAGDLLLDAGIVSTAGTGLQEAAISEVLPAGDYALAVVFDGVPTVRAADYPSAGGILGSLGAAVPGATDSVFFRTFTFGALPDPFGATSYGAGSTSPLIWMRTGV